MADVRNTPILSLGDETVIFEIVRRLRWAGVNLTNALGVMLVPAPPL